MSNSEPNAVPDQPRKFCECDHLLSIHSKETGRCLSQASDDDQCRCVRFDIFPSVIPPSVDPRVSYGQTSAPEPSRTDAVKLGEITARLLRLHPDPHTVEHEDVYYILTRLGNTDRALAEAERKLAEQNRINDVLAANNAVLMENAVHADQQLAAAEKRAKEAEAQFDNRQSYVRDMEGTLRDIGAALGYSSKNAEGLIEHAKEVGATNAALTRKLAMAVTGLQSIGHLFCIYDQPGSGPAFGGGRCIREFGDYCPHEQARDTLAAIDAPAGEPIAVTQFAVLEENAPPPEPANAQGSEAAPVRTCNAEEARGFAQQYERFGSLVTNVWNHVIAATLRHYADLLERDDALERAAANVLWVHGSGTLARDYILAAESQIAERDAQIKRAEALVAARDAQIVERELQIAEMRKVLGPKCPVCDGWLKASHWIGTNRLLPFVSQAFFPISCGEQQVGPCITVADLIANHPDIAAELGLTEDCNAE